ncbi:hypothetical protein ACFPT7_22565 [Acidicapsa dinghuensis]|uniref:Uncharacterized protein n=1 Tax=Acidicapsa dinghuensis TaxID=2218256 RepID=A0ABW1EPA9_9BACT|nr:hypothetical protein [Acidicapsa dinghuensis]
MDNLNKALLDIRDIRTQMALSTQFRGYGPATLVATSCIALTAATLQSIWIPDALHSTSVYLGIWVATAVVSASLICIQMFARTRRIHSGMAQEMIRTAVEQFLPAIGAGGLTTFVIARFAPSAVWMMPGLWQVIFSLGIFASCRFLPRLTMACGAWYLVTGLYCLSLGDARALSPWAMGIPYAVGQCLVAAILFFNAPENADEA